MSRGISLHIGLNHVDTAAYPDYIIPTLAGCINDANAMRNIAQSTGFTTTDTLIDGQATAMNVKNKILAAANELVSGDIFLLTYSGHGSQVPDETNQEEDNLNETWILYDRQLIDDELYAIWPQFQEGVRIFVLSDSCHSGTMVKMIILDAMAQKRNMKKRGIQKQKDLTLDDLNTVVETINKNRSRAPILSTVQKRSFPEVVALKNYYRNKELYQNIQQLSKMAKDASSITASLIFISGCQDNQTSGDGAVNGLFTGNLLRVWDNGNFSGTYRNFYDRILAVPMPPDQTPNYMTLGINIDTFEAQKPFTVLSQSGAATGGNDTAADVLPQVSGPVSWNSDCLPPCFNVDKGSNPYYYVEVATDYNLFNYNQNGSQRSDSNFYATWNDASTNYELLSEPQYQLSQTAWDNLKNADKLYYRVGSTMDTQWNGWMVTVTDENCADAPFIQIVVATEDATPATPSTGDTDTGSTPTDSGSTGSDSRIRNTVGASGRNDASDVTIIQQLLSQLQSEDGGTPSITVDGICGAGTIAAIKKFQRTNELNESGLFRPDKGSVILLYIKTNVASLTYNRAAHRKMAYA